MSEDSRRIPEKTSKTTAGKNENAKINYTATGYGNEHGSLHFGKIDRFGQVTAGVQLQGKDGRHQFTLDNDGVQVGVSSSARGKLIPMEGIDDGVNKVEDMKLIAIDCVADPSNPGSFVNGILESKQFILNSDGGYEALYDQFEKTLSNLPKKDIDTFLREQVIEFINKING